ncbi:MAG: ATP-dependent RecD-like DNA helicase [Deltaproteobacteria bacterium]|nr:ATP-dependent RecD-like DNA helicase [Deltaproteobacteria bacterium]HCH64429.1 ATP-dependent RecD-like DNA helicase [Deltaproteobacteria bacterium]
MSGENTLEGELIGFRWVSDDGSFAIARLRGPDQREVVAVGPLGHIQPGQHMTLRGHWETRSMFGRQFRARSVVVEDPKSLLGLERYLSDGAVKGLGPTFARRVVDHFGNDTLRIIDEEPQRLMEVSGIGKKRVATITEHWQTGRIHRELHTVLRGLGIGQALSNRIIDRFGAETQRVVTQDPYRLAAEIRGVGFRTADAIAREAGIPADDPSRADAAVRHVLRAGESDGHTFLPESDILERCADLSLPSSATAAALDRMARAQVVFRHDSQLPGSRPVFIEELELAEAYVAGRIHDLTQSAVLPPTDTAPDEDALGITLHPQQRQAVQRALQHGVAVVTGGPGTGKTTIVQVLLRSARRMGHQWLLAAPTGRAAQRLAEATGSEAKTLHRLLEFNPRTNDFNRNASNPLDAEGVLVDESSMVDLRLMAALLAALPDGCRLVLVGDADQLPSVGAGRVLADLIDSGAVPVATLTEVYRQAQDSGIVRNAWRIHQGKVPRSAEHDPDASDRRDFFVLPRTGADAASHTLVTVVCKRLAALGFDPARDVQVLTPMHGGPLGTTALNERLQAALNPNGPQLSDKRPFRVGDRVMQTRNNYDHDVFNGDVGEVEDVAGGICTVRFGTQRVALSGPELDHLTLAYAISIHKSQGSEYPAVVMVLHRSHHIMLRRNLVYTGITRARRFCCLVVDPDALARATHTVGSSHRYSRLSERLRDEPDTKASI